MPETAPLPTAAAENSEALRLEALRAAEILDSAPEVSFDTITRLAATHLQADSAYLAFVDETRVWAKSTCRSRWREFPRQGSMDERVIEEGKSTVFLDLGDADGAAGEKSTAGSTGQMGQVGQVGQTGFMRAGLIRVTGLRFFLGVPVRAANRQIIGVLCVFSLSPRDQVTAEELSLMEHLAELVTDQLELRQLRSTAKAGALRRRTSRLVADGDPYAVPRSADATTAWPQSNEIREGLERKEFVLYYQPEVELSTRRIMGMEALVRWKHPERGMVPPLDFIPQAEESGLILPLGDWGMGQACRQMQSWQRLWPNLASLRMCVNLSARQFSRVGLADHVESLLLETGLTGCQLGLEMTESSLIPNMADASRVLKGLQQLGVALLMDDFGTGYSSLSHLHRFPFDVLKIDRSFVQRMGEGEQPLQIVQTILELARVMEMDVVAEGIETEEQLLLLKKMGCRYGQGYLFSKPLPATAMGEYLGRADASQYPVSA